MKKLFTALAACVMLAVATSGDPGGTHAYDENSTTSLASIDAGNPDTPDVSAPAPVPLVEVRHFGLHEETVNAILASDSPEPILGGNYRLRHAMMNADDKPTIDRARRRLATIDNLHDKTTAVLNGAISDHPDNPLLC